MAKNLFDEFGIEYGTASGKDTSGLEIDPGMSQMLGQPQDMQQEMPQQQQATSAMENFVRENPRLAEYIAGWQWPQNEGVQKAANVAGRANEFIEDTGLPSAAGGFLQGLGNSGISTANLIPGLEIPHLDLRKHAPEGLVNDIAFGGGDISGRVLGFLLGGKGLGKAGSALGLSRPAGQAGLLADLGKNAAAGYATGENSEHEGRGLSALLSSVPGAALEWMSSKKVASRIAADKVAANKIGSDLYNKVFDEAEKQGIKSIKKTPKVDIKAIKKAAAGKYTHYLDEAAKSPTLNNLHKAQSDLGKWMRNVERTVESGAAPSTTIEAYKAAGEAQKKILDSMYKALGKEGVSPELAKSYTQAAANWKNDVVPYNKLKALDYFERGELGAEKTLKRLANNDKFALSIGEKYPELALGDFLKKGAKKAGSYAGGIGTGAATIGLGLSGAPKLKEILGLSSHED